MNKWTYICKRYVLVVSCSVALGRALTHAHTLHTQRGSNTPAWNSAPCICRAKTTSCWYCPALLFIWKVLWSRCITLNRLVKGLGWVDESVEDTLTGVVPPARTPTTMTIIMTMMTKMMTQENAVLQSVWPTVHHQKVTFGCPRMTMRAVYALLSVNHNFPLICKASVNLQHTGGYCMRHL